MIEGGVGGGHWHASPHKVDVTLISRRRGDQCFQASCISVRNSKVPQTVVTLRGSNGVGFRLAIDPLAARWQDTVAPKPCKLHCKVDFTLVPCSRFFQIYSFLEWNCHWPWAHGPIGRRRQSGKNKNKESRRCQEKTNAESRQMHENSILS